MKPQYIFLLLFLLIIIALVDLYTFRGIRKLTANFNPGIKTISLSLFWTITVIALLGLMIIYLLSDKISYNELFRLVTIFFGFFLLFYLPKIVFVLFQFLNDIVQWIGGFFQSGKEDISAEGMQGVNRRDFLLQIGIIAATIPFASIFHGIIHGRYNYKIQKVKLNFPNLPDEFEGTSIVQISDLHLGSFHGKTGKLKKAINIINSLDPDYILFTGDMVNNIAEEMNPFISLLSGLKAKKAKFSILGNHDYGEYYNWGSEDEWQENMQRLFDLEEKTGFRLLKNENVILESGDARIGLAGVENWGIEPFPQYGDVKKALSGLEEVPFKILMSHDPSHWDAIILPETDVDLTLSGHTHGMQFAIRIPGWTWSPVKMKYPRWSGIYQEGKQLLYVNIGLGFIAFPGRVGTPPEITFFELGKTKEK